MVTDTSVMSISRCSSGRQQWRWYISRTRGERSGADRSLQEHNQEPVTDKKKTVYYKSVHGEYIKVNNFSLLLAHLYSYFFESTVDKARCLGEYMNSIIKGRKTKKKKKKKKNLSVATIDPREFSPISSLLLLLLLLFIFTLWLDHKIRFSYKYTHTRTYKLCERGFSSPSSSFTCLYTVYDPNKRGEEQRGKRWGRRTTHQGVSIQIVILSNTPYVCDVCGKKSPVNRHRKREDPLIISK